MPLTRIISGGQTGADRGALDAARALGIETTGFAPRGWWTDDGPDPTLRGYGLIETEDRGYRTRTRLNVLSSDGTLIFGNPESPGCRLTRRCAREAHKPLLVWGWAPGDLPPPPEADVALREWIRVNGITMLNVAGNRERTAPGIHDALVAWLVRALHP